MIFLACAQKYRLYLKRVSGVHPSAGARGKGGKGGSDAAFQALMGAHGVHMPMAAGMQAGMMAPGMAHLAGAAGPPRELMHQMQMQQVGLLLSSCTSLSMTLASLLDVINVA